MLLFRTLVLCGLYVLGAHGLARAEESSPNDEEARALFQAGKVAFNNGRYEDSLSYFQRSYDLSQRPGLHYNIGLAQDRLRRDEDAIRSFEAYLAAVPDAERAEEVRARVDALRRALEDRDRAALPQDMDSNEQAGSRSWLRSWWLWTGVAVVVVTGTGLTALALSKDQAPSRPEPNTGVRIEALSW